MNADFESIHNHHEQAVFEAIRRAGPGYPLVAGNDLLPDVACVALNRLPPRYIPLYGTGLLFLEAPGRALARLSASLPELARSLARPTDGFGFEITIQGWG